MNPDFDCGCRPPDEYCPQHAEAGYRKPPRRGARGQQRGRGSDANPVIDLDAIMRPTTTPDGAA